METLRGLFADKLVEDDREPLWTFEIPHTQGTWGFFPPKLHQWSQIMMVRHQSEERVERPLSLS
jgi:hypothetical protein